MAGRLVARFAPLVRSGAAPCARSSHGVSAIANKLYVLGGEAEARVPIGMSVHVLPLEPSGTWRTIEQSTQSPPARIAHSQVVVGDGQLVIFGGRSGVQMDEAMGRAEGPPSRPKQQRTADPE